MEYHEPPFLQYRIGDYWFRSVNAVNLGLQRLGNSFWKTRTVLRIDCRVHSDRKCFIIMRNISIDAYHLDHVSRGLTLPERTDAGFLLGAEQKPKHMANYYFNPYMQKFIYRCHSGLHNVDGGLRNHL